MEKKLKVYKASAGSGKTFTLAVEYIKLLVMNPLNYRHILAVTFTNKATAEMKMRILSRLYGLYNQGEAEPLADSRDYLEEIKKDEEISRLALCDQEIRRRCGVALQYMMHDYSRFRIETIDSFFQSIIRELAHELNLTANLRVDLNDQEVLSEAVKQMIDQLTNDSEVFRSVFDFIQERIDANKNWRIDSELENFGRNIFNEQYLQCERSVREKMNDLKSLRHFKQKIFLLRNQTQTEIQQMGQDFLDICAKAGLTSDDFKGRSRSIYTLFFQKLANGEIPNISATVRKHLDSSDAWADRSRTDIQALAETQLMPLLQHSIDKLEDSIVVLNSISVIARHLNHLMLIDTVDRMVRQLNNDANRFLLADTAHFLRDLISGSDIPFIYERTGTQFHHIMIDEFQDTSMLQWENFKPLLLNSLSAHNRCLIVGDVKQSIYRWRNSDWGILNNIGDSEFAPYIDPTTLDKLDTNFRSREGIVTFNNDFFEHATRWLNQLYEQNTGQPSPDITKAYDRAAQKVSKKKEGGGYVRLELLTDEEKGDGAMLEHLVRSIDQLIDAGIPQSDIAILIRKNKYIPLISQYFSQERPNLRIVSDQAFRLDFSPVLQIMVMALRCLSNPNDHFARLQLAYRYQTDVLCNKIYEQDINTIFLLNDEELNQLLPQAFVEQMPQLVLLPLFEVAEQLYRLFQIHLIPQQDAYLFAFFDQLSAYLDGKPSDIENFLHYWDETLCATTIPNGAVDGIRILSIHKSKGLEFKHVIIPFCDWKISSDNNLLWCRPNQAPFNEMPLAPVNDSKAARNSIFKDDCNRELLKNYVDNLNLVYVAFTRAEESLIVLANDNGNNNVSALIANYLQINSSSAEASSKTPTVAPTFYEAGTISSSSTVPHGFPMSSDVPSNPVAKAEASNPLTQKPSSLPVSFSYTDNKAQFLQSNPSAQFVAGEDATTNEYIDEGNLIHALMAEISYPDDLDRAIRKLDSNGYFHSQAHRENIRRLMTGWLSDSRITGWFSPHWQVMNECSILFTEEGKVQERRPDRVITDGTETIVIDYKTGKQSADHEDQVRRYMQLLRDMGMPNVRGYLWYVRRKDIIEI